MLLLSVISFFSVLSKVMLVQQELVQRFAIPQYLGSESHLGHLFDHNCIVNGILYVLSPCKGCMTMYQYARHAFVVKFTEGFHDNLTRIRFVFSFYLLFGKGPGTWDLPIKIICMGSSIRWQTSASL